MTIEFFNYHLLSQGRPDILRTEIYCDYANRVLQGGKAVQKDCKIRLLGEISADISDIPVGDLEVERGKDQKLYYKLDCEIKATFLSASTRYTLWYKGNFESASLAWRPSSMLTPPQVKSEEQSHSILREQETILN